MIIITLTAFGNFKKNLKKKYQYYNNIYYLNYNDIYYCNNYCYTRGNKYTTRISLFLKNKNENLKVLEM